MPTSTLDGYDFVNFGPLTTTWTAAESCSTAIPNRAVALAEDLHPAWFYETCDFDDWEGGPPNGDCVPSGEKRDEYIRSRTNVGNPLTFLDYHSPGLHCPASWTTAGIAVKDDDGSISATGMFSMTRFSSGTETIDGPELPSQQPWPNRMAHALDSGETAIICCPSGYTVWGYGQCYSNFPIESITTSTLCFPLYSEFGTEVSATFTYNGEVITGIDYSATGTSPPEIAYIRTLILTDSDSPSQTLTGEYVEEAPPSLYTGHTQMIAIILVQRDGGGSGEGGDDGNGGSNNDSNSEGGDGNGDDDNEDAGCSTRTGLYGLLVALAAAWTFAWVADAS